MIADNDKRYLGNLCRRGHDFEGTGKSWRYKSSSQCCRCVAENNGRARGKPPESPSSDGADTPSAPAVLEPATCPHLRIDNGACMECGLGSQERPSSAAAFAGALLHDKWLCTPPSVVADSPPGVLPHLVAPRRAARAPDAGRRHDLLVAACSAMTVEAFARELGLGVAALIELALRASDDDGGGSPPPGGLAFPEGGSSDDEGSVETFAPRVRERGYTISLKRLTKDELRIGALLWPERPRRPTTRGECVDGIRPCPFVSCRYNLYLDVNEESGSIKYNKPRVEPWDVVESCALDVARRGGVTLDDVGEMLSVTRERVRQIELEALERLKRNPEASALFENMTLRAPLDDMVQDEPEADEVPR